MEHPPDLLIRDLVTLRRWRYGDEETVFQLCDSCLEHLTPWMPWAVDYDRKQADGYIESCEQDWLSGATYNYAVTVDGVAVGSCGLIRRIGPGGLEIGYWLHPDHTGRGLMTMAAAALTDAAFELADIDHVEIHHDAANVRSAGVPRRLGFVEVLRQPVAGGPTTSGESGVSVVWRRDRA